MSDTDKARRKREAAAARFFIRIGRVEAHAARRRDEWTIPLFPLPLILAADQTLAGDARHLVQS